MVRLQVMTVCTAIPSRTAFEYGAGVDVFGEVGGGGGGRGLG